MSRTFNRTRTSLDNAWCLCAGHHARQGADPTLTHHLAIATWGAAHAAQVRARARSTDGQRFDWDEEYERLKEIARRQSVPV